MTSSPPWLCVGEVFECVLLSSSWFQTFFFFCFDDHNSARLQTLTHTHTNCEGYNLALLLFVALLLRPSCRRSLGTSSLTVFRKNGSKKRKKLWEISQRLSYSEQQHNIPSQSPCDRVIPALTKDYWLKREVKPAICVPSECLFCFVNIGVCNHGHQGDHFMWKDIFFKIDELRLKLFAVKHSLVGLSLKDVWRCVPERCFFAPTWWKAANSKWFLLLIRPLIFKNRSMFCIRLPNSDVT